MLTADFIVEPLERSAGLMNVEFSVTVQIDAVELNMAVASDLSRIILSIILLLYLVRFYPVPLSDR